MDAEVRRLPVQHICKKYADHDQTSPVSSRVRVMHTVAGLNRNMGGPSFSVTRLCKAIGLQGAQVELLSQTDSSALDELALPSDRLVKTLPRLR